MARAKAKLPEPNTTVYTVTELKKPVEVRHGGFGDGGVPDADFPSQYAMNEHMADLWKRHERKFRKRFAAGQCVFTQFSIMANHPERTAVKGLFFVLTTNFYETPKEV